MLSGVRTAHQGLSQLGRLTSSYFFLGTLVLAIVGARLAWLDVFI